jgi:hypothetical protein
MYFRVCIRLSFLFLLLSWSCTASGQDRLARPAKKSLTYGFVSPNTREGLKLEDAISGLASPEEERLIRQVKRLGCVAQSRIITLKAIGSWSDGAEHSVLLRAQTDESTMRYLVSLLGRQAQQKAALYFHADSAGEAEMYTLKPRASRQTLGALARLLDKAGIEFRTLVPTRTAVLVYVVDLKRELRMKVMAASQRLRARVTSSRGAAQFIGDDSSRQKAAIVFDNEIRDFESKHSALVNKCAAQL